MDIAPDVITALQVVWQFLSENWATFVSAGAGTFAGAYLAFKFERDYN